MNKEKIKGLLRILSALLYLIPYIIFFKANYFVIVFYCLFVFVFAFYYIFRYKEAKKLKDFYQNHPEEVKTQQAKLLSWVVKSIFPKIVIGGAIFFALTYIVIWFLVKNGNI